MKTVGARIDDLYGDDGFRFAMLDILAALAVTDRAAEGELETLREGISATELLLRVATQ